MSVYALLFRSPCIPLRLQCNAKHTPMSDAICFPLLSMAGCNICFKRVLSHSYHLKCDYCQDPVHLKCLPMVSKTDSIYVNRGTDIWFCTKCTECMFPFYCINEDEDFKAALADMQNRQPEIPYEVLLNQNKIFSPFELNENIEIPISDIDPDIQFYNNQCIAALQSCDYYIEDTFNSKLTELNIKNGCLSMIHANVRSAAKNLNRFETYLSNLNHVFPIIALTETWARDDNVNLCNISGYNCEHNYRSSRSGGGVALFIKETIDYSVRDDLRYQNDTIEALFIEIDKSVFNKKQNIILGVIYRPPNTNIRTFNDYATQCLNQIKLEKKVAYLLGDFNINLLNSDNHAATQEFTDNMFSYSFIPQISKPTRVTMTSATLIDNIFSNDNTDDPSKLSGILYADISDHFPIFYIDHSGYTETTNSYIKKRIYKEENMHRFSTEMRAKDWNQVLSDDDAQRAYTTFYNNIHETYNSCFPLREFKQGYKTRKPWLSEGMKSSIKIKNRLYMKSKKTGKKEHELKYKQYKNILNKALIDAERKHYEKLLADNKSNLKKTWRILKEVINKKTSTNSCSKFKIGNQITNDKNMIAKGFNNFFINIGPTLANKIPADNRSPTLYMKNRVSEAMVITPVIEDEVRTIIKDLKDSSAGWDAISAKVIKATYNSFIHPVTHIMNLSLTTGVFPTELKIARVVPIFKSGDASSFSNYRPVSVLPLFSKILERLMYSRLLRFVNERNLLYAFQFGFRALHSPNLAMTVLVDKISKALEDGEYVLGLFLDFSKAFDTVNHDILYKKLEFYGVRGLPLQWFKSYLTSREQQVEYNNTTSSRGIIKCGVPQGSILGPLLFLIYINDLCEVSDKVFSILFADDSNLFLSGKDPNELIRTMNEEMVKIVDWLKLNKLSLNLKKTHFILFKRRKDNVSLTENLIVDNETISEVKNTKFLGIQVDEHLLFQKHIKYIKGKVARGIGILYKCKPYFTENTLMSLYYSFIYPHFTYCVEVWGNNYDSYLDPLVKLQKRAIRVITNSKKYDHTSPLFLKLHLLRFREIYVYCSQLFMYKHHHEILPNIFLEFFQRNNTIHDHHTRQEYFLHVPLVRKSLSAKNIRVVGVKLYNHFYDKIPLDISYPCYKKYLKNHLVKNEIDNLI